MAKRKKDGGYDMRTKEGKQAQEVKNFLEVQWVDVFSA